ncbi:MAG: cupin domain-containing protein [Devosia sp.]
MAMIDIPGDMTETPSRAPGGHAADLLSDLLGHLRLTGALFLRGAWTAPWAFDSPGCCGLIDLLSPGAERLIVFHTVREGHAWVAGGGYHVELEPGDLAILPSAHRHLIGSDDMAEPVQLDTLVPASPWDDVPVLRHGGGGALTNMVCGYFRCDELLFNSFMRSLPPLFRVRPSGAFAALIEAALGYALEDGERRGGGAGVARVPEMLLVEALRLYSQSTPQATGWLAATNDPVVGRALRLLHDAPTRQWTVDELARAAATSRSVLGERFKSLLDQSPMHYLAEWRMQLAANLLRTTRLRLATIAERSGYGSEAAFSRAFHRHVGVSPAQWRSAQTD